jgi:hypothetical protein
MANVFRAYQDEIYKYKFDGRIVVDQLMGGTPSDPKVAEGWLKTKMGLDKDTIIQNAVAEVMAQRNVTEGEALKEIDSKRHLNGFKRERCPNCPEKGLCGGTHPLIIEGRHMKAMLKEAASVARSVNNLPARMGSTNKGVLSFVAEHVIVVEKTLIVGVKDHATGKVVDAIEPTDILQSFPKNPITKQTGIQYCEFVENAHIDFTVVSDYDFTEQEWAAMWITGGNQGIGASRSQGYGRFEITKWDRRS